MKILEVRDLSKDFVKYHTRYEIILDMLFNTDHTHKQKRIKNINFTVNKGETFGILGDNASGKTVMLKLLAHQLLPTEGEIICDSKVFRHSYMTGMVESKTGYQNIYYKCGLYGLREYEIDAIAADIIKFSELADAIHEPYSSYSTSMRSKLGFAISIYIKSDIVLLDEAFAVGDGNFRKKCNDKFYELKRQGLTIVYASYSQHSIKASCERCMWLADGEVICVGNPQKVSVLYEMYLQREKTIEQIKHGLEVGLYAVH